MDLQTILNFFRSLTPAKLIPVIVILIVSLIIIHYLNKLFQKALSKTKIDKSLHKFLSSAFHILLYTILVLIIASQLGIDVTSLVALLSVVSLAISLAVQGTLSNIAGGIMVLTTHPFKVGDYVEVSGVDGTIKEIGMVHTVLLSIDNKEIFIPNSEISASKIINYTHEQKRRVDLKFTASYNCSVAAVKAALTKAADLPAVIKEDGIFVRVCAYRESDIEYIVRVWCRTEDYWDTYYNLMENVKHTFDAEGITMAYPHLNVHVTQEDEY